MHVFIKSWGKCNFSEVSLNHYPMQLTTIDSSKARYVSSGLEVGQESRSKPKLTQSFVHSDANRLRKLFTFENLYEWKKCRVSYLVAPKIYPTEILDGQCNHG